FLFRRSSIQRRGDLELSNAAPVRHRLGRLRRLPPAEYHAHTVYEVPRTSAPRRPSSTRRCRSRRPRPRPPRTRSRSGAGRRSSDDVSVIVARGHVVLPSARGLSDGPPTRAFHVVPDQLDVHLL